MQSGVAVHTLGPEPVMMYPHLRNTIVRLRFLGVLGVDFQDSPTVTKLTVYCWLHIIQARVGLAGALAGTNVWETNLWV